MIGGQPIVRFRSGRAEVNNNEKVQMRQGSGSRRSRGRPNGKRSFGQGPNRSFESNGPGVKLRGTAAQVFDKYLSLARDASTSGDRVSAENFYQHAEHYYRLHSTFNAEQKLRTESEQADDEDQRYEQEETRGNGESQPRAGATVVKAEEPTDPVAGTEASESTLAESSEQSDDSDEGGEKAPSKPRRRRRSGAAKNGEAETAV